MKCTLLLYKSFILITPEIYGFLELASVSSFLNRNSNARIYRIRWRFCCLYVSYSSIFIPIQHFSRLI